MKAIFNEDVNRVSCGLVIQGRKDDKTDWSRHAGRFEVKHKRKTP